jgi:quinol monooxygenase YgiN
MRTCHDGARMTVTVVAEIHGLGGTAQQLADLLVEHAAAQAAADGCLGSVAAQTLGAPAGEYTLTTRWRDEPALRAHYAGAEYQRYVERIGPLLARPSDVHISYVEREVAPVADLSLDPTRQG